MVLDAKYQLMQRFCTFAFVLGLILMVFGLTYCLPIVTAWIYQDGMEVYFTDGMSLNMGIGGALAY